MKKLSSELIYSLVGALVIFSFFIPKLVVGKIPIPADSIIGLYHPWRDIKIGGFNQEKFPVKNPLITDPVLQTYPWRYIAIKNIKAGDFPLWNPYSFSGQPLLANVQSAPFQILNLAFLALNFKLAWGFQIILVQVLTCIFMFFFLRNLSLSKTAAIFGSAVLPFSGFFLPWSSWETITATAMWLPLILLGISKLSQKVSPTWFLTVTLATSQIILSGHLQTAAYALFASCAFAIFRAVKTANKASFTFTIISIILGMLSSAILLLPLWEFIKLSARNIDQVYSPSRLDWFLPLQNLIQFIAPDYFGNPTTNNYWGVFNYAEFVGFFGIIPLTFSLSVLFVKDRLKNFFAALCLFSLLFAISNPISKIPYIYSWDLIASFQPSRILFLIVFSLVVLSSFGLDQFLKSQGKPLTVKKQILSAPASVIFILLLISLYTLTQKNNSPKISEISTFTVSIRNLVIPWAFALLAVAIFTMRNFKIKRNVLTFLIFAATFLELFRFSYKFTPFAKLDWIFPETKTTYFLQAQPKPFRIMATDRRIISPNSTTAYNIESVEGYDPLYLKDYNQFVSVWQSQNPQASSSSFNRIVTPQRYDSKLTNLANVKYVLTLDEITNPAFTLVLEEGSTKVYENKNFIPRAFFVQEIKKSHNAEDEFKKLLDPNFDLLQSATSQEFEVGYQNTISSAIIEDYGDQYIKIKTKTDKESPLVLTNIFYPGWNAYIDGRETSIKKADFVFDAVMVPQGNHQVEFKFKPQSFYNGLYISAVSLTGALFVAIFIWKRKYQ